MIRKRVLFWPTLARALTRSPWPIESQQREPTRRPPPWPTASTRPRIRRSTSPRSRPSGSAGPKTWRRRVRAAAIALVSGGNAVGPAQGRRVAPQPPCRLMGTHASPRVLAGRESGMHPGAGYPGCLHRLRRLRPARMAGTPPAPAATPPRGARATQLASFESPWHTPLAHTHAQTPGTLCSPYARQTPSPQLAPFPPVLHRPALRWRRRR